MVVQKSDEECARNVADPGCWEAFEYDNYCDRGSAQVWSYRIYARIPFKRKDVERIIRSWMKMNKVSNRSHVTLTGKNLAERWIEIDHRVPLEEDTSDEGGYCWE